MVFVIHKNTFMPKVCILLLFAVCCTVASFATVKRTSLKAAMDQGLIQVKASSAGRGYHAMRLQVKNTGASALQLTIDTGLIFRPADTSYQDLVIPGGDNLFVAAGRETSVELNSFCGKSYASTPADSLVYRFHEKADAGMVKVLGFILQHRLYDRLGQHAVWVLTNGHELAGVFDPERAALSQQLIALLAEVTGRPLPDYYRVYGINEQPGQIAFVPKVLKMYAQFEWKQESTQVMTLGIYDEAGRMVQPVAESQEFRNGGNRVTVEFEAEDVHAGKYFIRLMNGSTVVKEQMVLVE